MYIKRDMSLVSLNFHVFITCGIKDMVVSVPAKSPKIVIISTILREYALLKRL